MPEEFSARSEATKIERLAAGYFNDVTIDGENHVTGFIFNRPYSKVSVEHRSE